MLKKTTAMLIIYCMMLSVFTGAVQATDFKDVPDSDPYAGYIQLLKDNNITSGKGNSEFSPNETLTRAEFAVFMVRAFEIPASNVVLPFTDTKNHWALSFIQSAYKSGIVSGSTATTFAPNQTVKREEAALMMWRYLKSQGVESKTATLHGEDLPSSFAVEAVQNMVGYGFHGIGESLVYPEGAKYRPKQPMLRKEMAALLVRAMSELAVKQEADASNTIVVKDYWGTHMQPKIPQQGVVIKQFDAKGKLSYTNHITDVLNTKAEGFLTDNGDGTFAFANIPVSTVKSEIGKDDWAAEVTKRSKAAAEAFADLKLVATKERSFTANLPAVTGLNWKLYDPQAGGISIVTGTVHLTEGSELYLDNGSSSDKVDYIVLWAVFRSSDTELPGVQRIQGLNIN